MAATGAARRPPRSREGWARGAQSLGVRVIHIAERDTQAGTLRQRPGEFVNPWSVEGFVDEGTQPAELGWGCQERHVPGDGARHAAGSKAAIYLIRPGAGTRVRTWTPLAGAQHGFLITHAESISIADHLTLGNHGHPRYRPAVHHACHPCDDAVLSMHELAGRNWRKPSQARVLCPHNSATSLQVAAAVMAGVVWAMKNPARDIVEPDDLPHDAMLRLCRPDLGDVVGAYSDWTPLSGRDWPFDEDLDRDDPWQFDNFRVA